MKLTTAEILTIGDEILYGQITNTNAQFMSSRLSEIGIRVINHTTVGDNVEAILSALEQAEARVDVVLITGGLGPTKDDITKKTLADYYGSELIVNERVLQMVTDFFTKRGREITEINKKQALVPANCEVLYNDWGTAPAMWFERNGKVMVSMPGVPKEMEKLMTERAIPKLKSFFTLPIIIHKVIHTVGIGESMLAELIENWEDNLPKNMALAYLPNYSQVRLRLTGFGDDTAVLETETNNEIKKLIPIIEKYVFGYDEMTLEKAIAQLLLNQQKTIATAESCTGGYLSHLFTKIAGSSNYYMGGIVSYSNDIKIKQLGVDSTTLQNFGAVSEQTIKEMAENVRLKYQTDIGVATSGIAGPDGGTPEKPVGTVWIAYADEKGTFTKKLQLGGDRELNIHFSAIAVLDLIRRKLGGIID
jgi:nicotinamide-nucleotide amidase